jgi:hypothetical protein
VTDLRKLAKGQPCMMRIPGVCNFNPETTVLCHVRMVGMSGMGLKIHDMFGSWGCSACHDYVDGRAGKSGDQSSRRLMLLEGMVRTQHELLKRGYALTEAEIAQR